MPQSNRKPADWVRRIQTKCRDELHEWLMEEMGFEEYCKQQAVYWTEDTLPEPYHSAWKAYNNMPSLVEESWSTNQTH